MRKRNVIILILVFALLLGCYLYISYRPLKNKSEEDEQNTIELAKYDVKKINRMLLKSENGILELDKSGENWILKDKGDIKLDQSVINNIADSFANLSAEKVIEDNPKDTSEYGLNPPQVTATAYLDDGSEKTVLLGSKTPQGSSYYMMQPGDTKLYLLSSTAGERFSYGISDIRDKNIVTLDTNQVNSVSITFPNGRIEEMKKVEKGSPEEKQFAENTWILLKPYSSAYRLKADNMNNIVNALSSIKADGFVSDDPSDISKYGLDKPSLDVTATAGSSKVHVIFGSKPDDSSIYLKTDDSNTIYKVGSSVYDSFNKQPLDLIEKFVYLANIDDVDLIVIEKGSEKNVISFERTKKPAEKEGEEDQVVTTYRINGKAIEEDAFKSFYQSIIGIMADSENDSQVQGNADVKVTFTMNKGDEKQVIVSYCPYNADFYRAFRNGKSDFLVSKVQVQKMLDSMEKLLK